ncbi:MAG: hypothetical protein WCO63_13855 [Bacteroidota bacterium]
MKRLSEVIFIIVLLFPQVIFAQYGLGTNNPNPSAIIDATSTKKGWLMPRVALTATNVASPVSSPAISLLVYNTATAGTTPNNVTPGFYYWNGSSWIRFFTGSEVDGSITNELQNLSYTTSTGAVGISSGAGITIPLFSSSSSDPGLVRGSNNVGSNYYLNGSGTWSMPQSSGNSNIYADVYFTTGATPPATGTPLNLTLVTTNVYYLLNQALSGSSSHGDITAQSNPLKITIQESGKYLLSMSIDYRVNCNNCVFYGQAYINGVPNLRHRFRNTFRTPGDYLTNSGINTVISLSEGDYIEMYFMTDVTNTPITIYTFDFFIQRLSD